ncbi:MAG: hypothetical protein Q8M53_13975 [Burkholderiales bacterium]|nr:hypothetical protein [Burkholderiales bacterium]
MNYRILILGASYGSLLGSKLLMAGHRVSLVCTAPTARLINREGTQVRFPLRDRAPLELDSRRLPGTLDALTPDAADPRQYDLIVLGMQEAQYGSAGVRGLMRRIARTPKPCLAIMNMPPLPYLRRLPGLFVDALESCYTDPELWDGFDPARITLASPDPQAFRPPEAAKNVLQVGLPTNFKAARFESAEHNALLRDIEAGIEAARYVEDGVALEIPVKLKVHDSLFVPLAKWPMLATGNYRCIRRHDMIPIREAVHADLERSRRIYDWTAGLCMSLGAEPGDLVPFDKYAKAAEGLAKPSSAARALFGGAQHIERVDRLLQLVAWQQGSECAVLEEIVGFVDARLETNRAAAAVRQPPSTPQLGFVRLPEPALA